jgi:hypothetical protein
MLANYRQQPEKEFKNIFRVTIDDLNLFFARKNLSKPVNDGQTRVSLDILKECGYIDGLCQLLDTDKENGIVGDKMDLDRRRRYFGRHSLPMPRMESFWGVKLPRQYEDSTT